MRKRIYFYQLNSSGKLRQTPYNWITTKDESLLSIFVEKQIKRVKECNKIETNRGKQSK